MQHFRVSAQQMVSFHDFTRFLRVGALELLLQMKELLSNHDPSCHNQIENILILAVCGLRYTGLRIWIHEVRSMQQH